MATLTRFSFLLLVFAMMPTQGLVAQEGTAKEPSRSAAPEQTTDDSSVILSKTYCDVPSCVQKVLYFSNISQPTDMQDVVNAMRAIADIPRVQQLLGEQIIIVEGTAEQVAMAERLAAEIDKDKRRFGGLGYRIDVKIEEADGEKKLHSKLYSLLTEARQSAKVSVGRQAPAQAQNVGASETKQASDSTGGRSIECRVLAEYEHSLEMIVDVAFSSDTAHDPSVGSAPMLQARAHVTVELDKPTVISRIDDPDGNSRYTIELTATRVKER